MFYMKFFKLNKLDNYFAFLILIKLNILVLKYC